MSRRTVCAGEIGDFAGLPVHITDRWHGPGALLVSDPPGSAMLVLPATRPTLRLPLLEAAATYPLPGVAMITPSWFDPARWPERERIDW